MALTLFPKASRVAQCISSRYNSSDSRVGVSCFSRDVLKPSEQRNGPVATQPGFGGVRFYQNNHGLFWMQRQQLSTGVACSSPDYLPRQGKMLKKLMSGSRKKWYDFEKRVEKPNLGGSNFLTPAKVKNPRRVHVLNAVMIRYVTDLLGSGEVIPEIAGRGVEITKVKINNDYTCLNVYWMTSKPEESEELTIWLNSNAGKLRSLLCQHNVIGNVPYIYFVKDEYQKHVNDVEALLARADFGDDFKPKDSSHHVKVTSILKQSLPDIPELKELEIQNGKVIPDLNETDDCCLTADSTTSNGEMRMDILGVKHNAILAQVQKKLNQVLAMRGTNPTTVSDTAGQLPEVNLSPLTSPELSNTGSGENRDTNKFLSSADITQFLLQRKKEKYIEKKQKAKMLASEESAFDSRFSLRDNQDLDNDDTNYEKNFAFDDEYDENSEIDGNYDVESDGYNK